MPSPRLLGTAIALLFAASPLPGQLPNPTLDSLFPPGGQAGSTVEVRLGGTDLDDPRGLRFSHPGIVAEPVLKPADAFWPEPRPDGLKFKVTIAPDVPPGFHEARLAGHFGLSTARLFEVRPAGGPPEIVHPGAPHTTPDNPLPIALEQTVSGKAVAQQPCYHRLDLAAGQRVLCHLRAATLDSRLDPRIAVLDASGRELAAANGTGEYDPVLDFTAPAAGPYTIRVHDFLHRGGDAYFYRLTASTAPHLDAILPAAAQPGTHQTFTLIGRNLTGGTPWTDARWQTASREADVPATPDSVTLPGLKPARSLAPVVLLEGVRLGLTDFPVVLEEEARKQPLTVPADVSGAIDFLGNVDTFRFQTKAGTAYQIEAISHRQGFDTDLSLAVQRVVPGAGGAESLEAAGESDDLFSVTSNGFDARVRDPGLTVTAKADGLYQVEVRNLADQYGPGQGYRLVIREAKPDLALFAVEERAHLLPNQAFPAVPVLAPGHRAEIRVIAFRSGGLTGPVQVAATGLPPGVTALPATIWPQSQDTLLVLQAAPDASPWEGTIEVTGTCGEVTRTALAGTLKWGVANATTERTASRVTSGLGLAVSPAAPPRLRVEVTPSSGSVELGKDLTFQVKIDRNGAVKGPVTITPVGLPGFNRPPTLSIAEKDSEGSLKISFAPDANNKPAVGNGTVLLRAAAIAPAFQTNPEAVARLTKWKEFQDAAIAKIDPSDAAAQKAGTAARTELAALLKAATDRAKDRDAAFTVSSAPVELTITAPAPAKPTP